MTKNEDLKPTIFTEDGQIRFLKIRDQVQQKLKASGAINLESAITGIGGDTWQMLACVDRLVELGELREIKQGDVAGQYRIFVEGPVDPDLDL